ncbi:3de85bb1-28ca-40a6-a6d2-c913737ebea1 [Sclerotinia trifoliorum]|uniref:3de85bb1-28ca-40a6-a6d2-c913737ebea1 n=1 Tax=Sclerotinia trifoliorum TaxID=28548 RepID=A0A8H2VRN6_9HELO|nr:3de85bb1-28ca-40a6-a6d2-c913737ebea1 [Sclerotinia trifoliorum]
MQFSTLLTLGLAAISGVAAAPTDSFNIDITFIGGPASYNLTVPATGYTQLTSNALSVSLIRSSNFDVFHLCTFSFASPATLVNNGGIISVGPPTPITAVSCPPTDQRCIPNYNDCYSSTTGQFLGSCCDGFCAANKCRPFSGV